MMTGWPEDAQRYFNWDSWTRDLRHDYTVEDAPGDGVYVFRNLCPQKKNPSTRGLGFIF